MIEGLSKMTTTYKKPKRRNKRSYLDGKMVLVTGGTGSFGKKFIEIVLKEYNVKRLVVYSRDELKQEEMRTMRGFDDPRLRYFVGDVRDRDRLWRAMVDIDVVVHAAAMKQVPACEYNPTEAIATNIAGAQNIINVAIDRRVKRVLALSTDKAVSPVNLYGATKLVAEKLFVAGNNYSSWDGARFSCVRYGNVVGSRGSIVPLLQYQKEKGVITITDKQMTRFWLTLEQGVRLVISSIETMVGGEIFIPKIPSMRLMDLAKTVAPGCKIKITGIRPGEKLHETLISREEMVNTYELKDKYVIRPTSLFKEVPSSLWKSKKSTQIEQYSSDNNTVWLDEKGLIKLINQSK